MKEFTLSHKNSGYERIIDELEFSVLSQIEVVLPFICSGCGNVHLSPFFLMHCENEGKDVSSELEFLFEKISYHREKYAEESIDKQIKEALNTNRKECSCGDYKLVSQKDRFSVDTGWITVFKCRCGQEKIVKHED